MSEDRTRRSIIFPADVAKAAAIAAAIEGVSVNEYVVRVVRAASESAVRAWKESQDGEESQ